MKMKITLFVIALMVLVQAVAASDIGVGASPGNMSYRLAPGTSAEQSLYVINTGTETATYGVFVDDSTYASWFTFSTSSFDLRAGENKEVKVTLRVPASAEEDADCRIKIPCTVPGGDVGTGVIIPVHIEISTSEESSSRVSSSGGTSSGGRGGSPEPSSNVEVKELSQQYVVSGNRVRFDFTQNATCVTYVEFDARKNLGKITTIVEMLKDKSMLTPDTPGGEVYNYLNIWTGNNGTAIPENIENAVICFRVSKTWIDENEIDANSITLDSYDNGKWEPLSTKKVREDEGYIYLEAETTGFSHFAIVSEKSDGADRNLELAPVTRISEKLKETADDLEAAAVRSFDEKSPGILAEIENYEEKLHNFYLTLVHFLQEKFRKPV